MERRSLHTLVDVSSTATKANDDVDDDERDENHSKNNKNNDPPWRNTGLHHPSLVRG